MTPSANEIDVYPRPYANYTLLERLATGGMSQVDLARRSVDDTGYVRFLVVKRIRANHVEDEAFVRMFKDEARITSELRHTHIAQVYDFGRVGDEYYLALEYVPGTDLRLVLNLLRKRRKRMPVRMALRVAHDVLDALHYAHTRTDGRGDAMRIVHRDVNPRNIMISVTGEVKLIDFGVARATDRLERTQTDHFKGKVAYMAPEQIEGKNLDHRVDLFAMALTLYEMLVGAGPFAGLDQTQILFRIMQGNLPSLTVPREWGSAGRQLSDVVDRALCTDPNDRYPDAEEMRRAIAQVAEAFGGLPRSAELQAWLHDLDPDLEPRVRRKLDSWSGPIHIPDADADAGESPEAPLPLDSSGTLERDLGALDPSSGSFSSTARVIATGGIGFLAVLLVGGAFLVALGLVVGGVVMVYRPGWIADPGELSAATEDLPDPAPSFEPVVEPTRPSGEPGTDLPDSEPLDDRSAPAGAGSATRAVQTDSRPSGTSTPASSGRVKSAPTSTTTERAPVTIREVAPAREPEPASEPGPAPESEAAPTRVRFGDGEDRATDPASTSAGTSESDDGDPAGSRASGRREDPRSSASTEDTAPTAPPRPDGPDPAKVSKLHIIASKKGVPVYINGERTSYRTGDSFEWPAGQLTVSAEGFASQTVQTHAGLAKYITLKP